MGRYVKQVYFSTVTDRDLIEKAKKMPNFSAYIKGLMRRDEILSDIRLALKGLSNARNEKLERETLNQFL